MTEEEIDRLLRREWQIDCRQIRLTQRTSHEPLTYSGTGWIRQENDGSLKFKILADQGLRQFDRGFGQQHAPGTVHPETAYYDLSAVDENGREWRAERIRPSEVVERLRHHTVRGKIPRIAYYTDEGQVLPTVVTVLFPGRIEIPCTTGTDVQTTIDGSLWAMSSHTNVAQFTSCGHRMQLLADEDRLRLTIRRSGEALQPLTEARVIEALEFVLARRMTPLLIQRRAESTEYIEVRAMSATWSGRVFPPIAFTRVENVATVWALFDRYFTYIRRHEGPGRHPLSQKLRAVLEGCEASIDAHALTVAVAVESILKSEALKPGTLQIELVSQVKAAVALLQKSGLDPAFRERAMAKVNELRNPSAAANLRELVKTQAITDRQFRAWRDLRNRTAHGDYSDSIPLQDFMDLLTTVTTLLHRLAFTAIGYVGPYTDYGQRGWPQTIHDPQVPE